MIVRARVPLGHTILSIIIELGSGPGVGARSDIAPGIVLAHVNLVATALTGTRRTQLIEARQLVRMRAITVEVLILVVLPVKWSLPDLVQVRVGKGIIVVSTRKGVRETTVAT